MARCDEYDNDIWPRAHDEDVRSLISCLLNARWRWQPRDQSTSTSTGREVVTMILLVGRRASSMLRATWDNFDEGVVAAR